MSKRGQAPPPASCPPMTSMPPAAAGTAVPPVALVACFGCAAGACGHEDCDGAVPMVTYFEGTALCRDCAADVAADPPAGED